MSGCNNCIGPILPPGFIRQLNEGEGSEDCKGPEGPSLPPDSSTENVEAKDTPEHEHTYGPSLPPGFSSAASPLEQQDSSSSNEDSDEEEEVIGPMPCVAGDMDNEELKQRKRREIEAYSQAMKDKLTGKRSEDAGPRREEWMLELPPEYKPLGIGPRKFRSKVPETSDRSVWTDTPADRLKKIEEAHSGRKGDTSKEKKKEPTYASVEVQQRLLAKTVEKHNKEHRSESLMDIHKRKRAREKAEGANKVAERRPFDREIDLEAPRNMVTPAKRRALMDESRQSLDSKFQHGAQSFL